MANTYAPFTENQYEYLHRSLTSWFNVAEGGKRGGKNVLQVLAFCTALQTHPSRIHLIAGVSQPNAGVNIVDCDGFGLANFFEGQFREGKHEGKTALFVQTPVGEKIILISGGGKDGDEKYIKGNTYGMAYVTEANECHPKFIKEVFDRTSSSPCRKVFHDLNPKDENHWYYTEILAHHQEMDRKYPNYGYNYGHFTISDNLSIPDDQLRTILRSYKKGTVWYRRDIRGERCAAEGLVYPQFVDNEDDYYITVDEVPRDTRPIYVGQDFGGNKSKHTYCASAVSRDGRTLYVLASDEDTATGTKVNFIVNSLGSFINRVEGIYGRRVDRVYADSMEQAIVNTEKGVYGASFIHNSIKNEVVDRIRCEDLLLSTKRIKIVKEHNKSLIAALRSATWDPKADKDTRYDNPSAGSNICPLDALEYSFEAHIRDLTRRL